MNLIAGAAVLIEAKRDQCEVVGNSEHPVPILSDVASTGLIREPNLHRVAAE
jgi:hypothetical protein